jgi:hypothetical protein
VLKAIENKTFREVKKILSPLAPPIKIKQQVYQEQVILKVELTHEQHKKINQLKISYT